MTAFLFGTLLSLALALNPASAGLWQFYAGNELDAAIVQVHGDSGSGSGFVVGIDLATDQAKIISAGHIGRINRVTWHDGTQSTRAWTAYKQWGQVVNSKDVQLVIADGTPETVTTIKIADDYKPISQALVIGWGGGTLRKFIAPVSEVSTRQKIRLGDGAYVISGDSGGLICDGKGEAIAVISGGWEVSYAKSDNGTTGLHSPPTGSGIQAMLDAIKGHTLTQRCKDGNCQPKVLFDDQYSPKATSPTFDQAPIVEGLQRLDDRLASIEKKEFPAIPEFDYAKIQFPEFPEPPSQEPILKGMEGLRDAIDAIELPDSSDAIAKGIRESTATLVAAISNHVPVPVEESTGIDTRAFIAGVLSAGGAIGLIALTATALQRRIDHVKLNRYVVKLNRYVDRRQPSESIESIFNNKPAPKPRKPKTTKTF